MIIPPYTLEKLKTLSMPELRQIWHTLWGKPAHILIKRPMLEKSILFKQAENNGQAYTTEQKQQLDKLLANYNKKPESLDQQTSKQAPPLGTRLVKMWKGQKHVVTITQGGYEHEGVLYKSISKIATHITGTTWNGWVFFGLKTFKSKS